MNYERASSIFKALGHPTRLRILALLRDADACVQKLEMDLGLKQPNISQHLRILKDLGLVRMKRDGQTSCYSLNVDLLQPLLAYMESECAEAAAPLIPNEPAGAGDQPNGRM